MTGFAMTIKLFIIVLVAAAFGWGFSELVEQSDNTLRPENGRYACEQWSGNDCTRQFER